MSDLKIYLNEIELEALAYHAIYRSGWSESEWTNWVENNVAVIQPLD